MHREQPDLTAYVLGATEELSPALVQTSSEPAVFKYMVESIMEAPDDTEDPVAMTPHESGSLYLVLQTAIDLLHEAREGATSRRPRR